MKFRLWSQSTRPQSVQGYLQNTQFCWCLCFLSDCRRVEILVAPSFRSGIILMVIPLNILRHNFFRDLSCFFCHIKLQVLYCCTLHAKNESVSSSSGKAFKGNYLELFAAKSPLPVVECSDFYLCRIPGLKFVKGPTKYLPSFTSGSCNLAAKAKSLFRNPCWTSKGTWLLTFGKRHHLYQQLV